MPCCERWAGQQDRGGTLLAQLLLALCCGQGKGWVHTRHPPHGQGEHRRVFAPVPGTVEARGGRALLVSLQAGWGLPEPGGTCGCVCQDGRACRWQAENLGRLEQPWLGPPATGTGRLWQQPLGTGIEGTFGSWHDGWGAQALIDKFIFQQCVLHVIMSAHFSLWQKFHR